MQNSHFRSLAFIVCCFLSTSATVHAAGFQSTNVSYVETHIYPRAETLDLVFQNLDNATVDLCRNETVNASRLWRKYHEASDAWQNFQHLRLGPLTDYDQMHRLEFWPDKRNKVGKALLALEAKQKSGQAVNIKNIKGGSVAAQGFPILERLLFSGDEVLSLKQCELLVAVTGNIANIGHAVHKGWKDKEAGYGVELTQVLEIKELYPDVMSVTADLFTNLMTGLQWVEDTKIRKALRENATKAKPRRLENWRSGRSFKNLILNIKALEESYVLVFSPHLKSLREGAEKDELIMASFKDSLKKLETLVDVKPEEINESNVWQSLDQSATSLRSVRAALYDAGKLMGIPVGFNSLDGD